jgi:hypothetical protein
MRGGVTVHTIFWAPPGYAFAGSPGGGALGYKALVEQFYTDVAHDSGTTGNAFSILDQYPDSGGPGQYQIAYNTAADAISDTDPYPSQANQCPSPTGIATCVTDLQVQQEIDHIIQLSDPGGRGLHDVWFVFLPPNVDECSQLGECGTNAFAGYHSLGNVGHGFFIYAIVIDPLIEGVFPPGADPEGNPDAEATIDTAAHETIEAMTNPEGAGWMDPNGFEVADKCENPEYGNLLGYAPDGSPYNELINSHQYLFQAMWSNAVEGCVASSTTTTSPLPLATVDLKQFSPEVSGNTGQPKAGVGVEVALERASDLVGVGITHTRAGGGWGPVGIRAPSGTLHAVGDDRDEILVRYGSGGPKPDLILTGDGGNPFTESGWTGWYDLDTGGEVEGGSVALSPCSQVGVLTLTAGSSTTTPPIDNCETESDLSDLPARSITGRTAVTLSSLDNRATSYLNPDGALVKLTVSLGEPFSVSALGNAQIPINQTGFPACTADLRAQSVSCNGLVADARYTVTRRRGRAARHATSSRAGRISIGGFREGIRGGDVLVLTNRARRVLTTLHVAHLRVNIKGEQDAIASGRCQPGDYYGPPVQQVPLSPGVGLQGVSGDGVVCPASGNAHGLSATLIEQIDDFSGGQTRTEVPMLTGTSPLNDETVYGPFTALAQAGLPGPRGVDFSTGTRIALTITHSSGGRAVFKAGNVDTAGGVLVAKLSAGGYLATWVVTDPNGDTRTVQTRFVEQG